MTEIAVIIYGGKCDSIGVANCRPGCSYMNLFVSCENLRGYSMSHWAILFHDSLSDSSQNRRLWSGEDLLLIASQSTTTTLVISLLENKKYFTGAKIFHI